MKNRLNIKLRNIIILSIAFILIVFTHWAVSNNVGAIVISGDNDASMAQDVNKMVDALNSGSYSIPKSNIYSGTNQTFNQFKSAIQSMNNKGVTELHIYVSSHGNKNGVEFTQGSLISGESIATAISKSTASNKHIVLDSCFSGAHYPDLNSVKGPQGTVSTSTDNNSKSLMSWLGTGSYYTDAYTDALLDPSNDINKDGKVDHDEASQEVKSNGGMLPNWGNPKIYNIPTLSEWKQIFLTFLIISLIIGYIPTHHQTMPPQNAKNNEEMKFSFTLPYFNRSTYFSMLKKVSFLVLLGFIVCILLLELIPLIDIIGTILCTPLIAYIAHIGILCHTPKFKLIWS